MLRNKIWGHTSKLFTVCTLTRTTDRLISSQTHSQELETRETAADQQRASRAEVLVEETVNTFPARREREREREDEFVWGSGPPQPPGTGHSLHLFSCGSALVTAAPSEKSGSRQQHSLAQVQGRKKRKNNITSCVTSASAVTATGGKKTQLGLPLTFKHF